MNIAPQIFVLFIGFVFFLHSPLRAVAEHDDELILQDILA